MPKPIPPSLKDIYENFKRADNPLTDEELNFLIENIEKTIELLEQFGQRFWIAADALRRDLQTLQGFKFARNDHD